jgi:hypothetical protein
MEMTEKYVILADVTCDLNEQIREKIGMKDYIPGHVHFDDGRDLPTTLDWSHISREDFYAAQSERFVQETFDGSLPAFLAAFTKRKGLTQEEVAHLRKMVAEYEEE